MTGVSNFLCSSDSFEIANLIEYRHLGDKNTKTSCLLLGVVIIEVQMRVNLKQGLKA